MRRAARALSCAVAALAATVPNANAELAFTEPAQLATAPFYANVVAIDRGDLNADGRMDLVATNGPVNYDSPPFVHNHSFGSVAVLLAAGPGTFAPAVTTVADSDLHDVVPGKTNA